jgi:Matrixin
MAADYTLENVKWGTSGVDGTPGGTVAWSLFGGFGSEFRSEVQAAFEKWSAVANVQFVELADNQNADIDLSWASIDGPGNILGQTGYYYNGGLLSSATIQFDSGENWSMSANGLSEGGGYFEAVALHEIGHAIGLGHYDASTAIMNAFLTPGLKDLTPSDIDGAQAIYGTAPSSNFNMVIQNPDTHQIDFLQFAGGSLKSSALASFTAWKIVADGDFNGDGHPDLLTQSNNGQIDLLFLSGANLSGSSLEEGFYWPAHGAGDTDHSGRAGVLTQDASSGQIDFLWFSGTKLTSSLLVSGSYWNAVGLVDVNHDGKADVVTQNAATGQIDFLFLDGPNLAGSYLVPGEYGPVKSAHVNAAGQLDLVTQDPRTGQVDHLVFDGMQLLSDQQIPHHPGWDVVNGAAVADWLLHG